MMLYTCMKLSKDKYKIETVLWGIQLGLLSEYELHGLLKGTEVTKNDVIQRACLSLCACMLVMQRLFLDLTIRKAGRL